MADVPPTKESGSDARQRSHQRTLDMLQACEAERDALREALKEVSSAYGDFAGCSAGTRNGAPESEHTPACRQARAALGYR